MDIQIEESWKSILKEEFESPYFNILIEFIDSEYQNYQCYPPKNLLFEAFNLCDFKDLKVVIIGQDPYHGPSQANGLCFSVWDGQKFPPSLRNIFIELNNDLNIPIPISGNLENWAKQGVLLLNDTLSVREKSPGSHQKKGWERFTEAVIDKINNQKENVVFLLWGSFAKEKGKKIDRTKHLVLESGHPSPMSANRGHWFGNKHFSKTNTYLKSKNITEINWQL